MQAYTKTISRDGTAWEIDVTPQPVRPEWGTHVATVVWHVRVRSSALGIAAFLLPPQASASEAERVGKAWVLDSTLRRAKQRNALIKALGGTVRSGNLYGRRPVRVQTTLHPAPYEHGYAPPVHHASPALLPALETAVQTAAQRDALITAAIERKKAATR